MLRNDRKSSKRLKLQLNKLRYMITNFIGDITDV